MAAALIDSTEAARLTGMSIRMIRKLVAARVVPVVRIGTAVRFRPEDIEAYISAHTEPAL